MQNTFCTDHAPVASHTRQSIAAAAARAAENAHNGILVRHAGRIALQALVPVPEPVVQPTLEEIRAAIPDHGIMLPEFFQLFLSRVRSSGSYKAFLVNFQALAAQDPVTGLIFAKVTPAQASAMQNADGNATAPTPKPDVPLTLEGIALAVARAANNTDNQIYMGGAWRATTGKAPMDPTPLTLDEIRAAIPEQGITVRDLIYLFHSRLAHNMDSFNMFISLIVTVAQQDPCTNLIFLRK